MFVFVPQSDAGDINVSVSHRNQTEIFFAGRFAPSRKLRNRTSRCGLRALPAGVGVNFGVEDQDIDIPTAGQDMVETAVTDVVSPTVAPDNPNAFAHQLISKAQKK